MTVIFSLVVTNESGKTFISVSARVSSGYGAVIKIIPRSIKSIN
jgi:hypothetical protein